MEKMKLFKEMTPEQIMLVNPNISREAASAMASKFSEDNMKMVAENATDQAKRMQAFLEKMAEEQRQIVDAALGGGRRKTGKDEKESDGAKSSKSKGQAGSKDEDDE